MLKSLVLENFQGHKFSHLEFAPGVNVITGESNKGKSSIIRALVWAVTNRPAGAGENWRRWGADKKEMVAVRVGLDNGEIARYRKGTENGYVISGENLEGITTLQAIRSGVPTEVDRLFQLGEQNIQTQHNPYFLVEDTPGEVARKLNAVCGLDIIDLCLKNSNQLLSETTRNRNHTHEQIDSLQARIKELEGVERLEELVEQVEGGERVVVELEKEIDELEQQEFAISGLKKGIAEFDEFLEWEPRVLAVLAGYAEVERLSKELSGVELWINTFHLLQNRIGENEETMNRLQGEIEECQKMLGVCPTCGQEILNG